MAGVGRWAAVGDGVHSRKDVEGLHHDKTGDDGVSGSDSGNDITSHFYSGYQY